MQIDEISKGGAVEVEVKLDGKTLNFRSEIVLVKNNSILITSIKVNEQTVGFSDKCHINLLYKYDSKVYIWKDVVAKLVKYDGEIYHKIDLDGEGKPYNRRGSFRLYIGEEMPLYVNSASGPSALNVLVKDLSETGVGFITKEELDLDRIVRLKLKDNNTIISLSAVIVRKEFLINLGATLYGCRFNEKSDKLGKLIARKQGEVLRKKMTTYSSPRSKDKAVKFGEE